MKKSTRKDKRKKLQIGRLPAIMMFIFLFLAASALAYRSKAVWVIKSESDYNNLAVLLYRAGDIGKSVEFFKKSIEKNNGYAKGHYNLALLFFEIGDYDSSIKHFENAALLERENANIRFDLAVAYSKRFMEKESKASISQNDLEDLKKSVENYKFALELKPSFPHAEDNLKIVLDVLKGYEK